MTHSQHRLRVGDLIVSTGEDTFESADGYTFDVYGEGFDRGKVVSVDVAIRTALQDGGRVFTESYGMREFAFFVVVGGADSVARAKGEEALAAACGIRTEIGWISPDGMSAESVWDVETSDLPALVEDDLLEVQQGQVVYALRFTCQPFARPNTMDTVAALGDTTGITPNTVTIDAGNTTTRWTARIGTLSDQGSFLRISGSKSPRAVWTGAAPADTSVNEYVALEYTYDPAEGTVPIPYLLADGVYAEVVALTDGSTLARKVTWRVAASSVASMEFGLNLAATRTFDFATLTASNVPPFYGSTKQTARTIEVKGSARTQGKLSIFAPSGQTLGTVLAYTSTADAEAPSLRRSRVSGGVPISAPGSITGTREVMDSGVVFEVPVSQLHSGKHQLIGRFYAVTTESFTLTYAAQAVVGGVAVGAIESGTASLSGTAGTFFTAALGNVNLPPSDLPATSSALVRITLTCADVNLTFDEAWAYNVEPRVGALTWVEVGAKRRLWIETPTVARPHPAIFIGNNEDQSDAYYASVIESWGSHEFFGTTSIHLTTSDTDAGQAQYDYYRRYVNTVLEGGA